jgi:hypothetical protein
LAEQYLNYISLEMVLNGDANELMNDLAYGDTTDDDILAMICPPDNSNDAQQSN